MSLKKLSPILPQNHNCVCALEQPDLNIILYYLGMFSDANSGGSGRASSIIIKPLTALTLTQATLLDRLARRQSDHLDMRHYFLIVVLVEIFYGAVSGQIYNVGRNPSRQFFQQNSPQSNGNQNPFQQYLSNTNIQPQKAKNHQMEEIYFQIPSETLNHLENK
ncbi:hypothetical protein CEXT_724771 [Caerostris extrusa]|uniref:Uncharacterized protein n=1 Tax=Caerostris extrusa TaxID=172846 RepID=A0AAV4S4P1_CAEEX|nr:hypothetical protein CEXT_724771 [Caerostris extrusa]